MYAAQRLFREILEREGLDRRDMPFALQGDAVAGLLEVCGQRPDAVVEPRMVGVGARADGIKPREQAVACRGAHGRRLEEPLETNALRGQMVDVGRDGVGASVAPQVVMAAVVGDDEHDVGALRALFGRGFRGLCGAAGEQGQRGSESDFSGRDRFGFHTVRFRVGRAEGYCCPPPMRGRRSHQASTVFERSRTSAGFVSARFFVSSMSSSML